MNDIPPTDTEMLDWMLEYGARALAIKDTDEFLVSWFQGDERFTAISTESKRQAIAQAMKESQL